jgi:hypothetical protein
MKKSSPKLKSFILFNKISEIKHRQIIANVLLIIILGIQIFNSIEAIGLFDTIK